MVQDKIKVTVWNEFRHERNDEAIRAIYPDGLHAVIGKALSQDAALEVRLAALDDAEQGLPADVLNDTDILLWWGHMAHHEVSDALVEAIKQRVYLGKMGLVVLHSGHHSKVFRGVVGTSGNLSWGRTQKEIVWTLNPTHPIAQGIPDHFCLPQEELYAEPFYIGEPDETVFASWFEDGFVMRSGVVFKRSAGKIFYFQPGHEECPSYYNEWVQKIIHNAVYYVKPTAAAAAVPDGAPCWMFRAADEFDA
jgi:trehalose utilization protein